MTHIFNSIGSNFISFFDNNPNIDNTIYKLPGDDGLWWNSGGTPIDLTDTGGDVTGPATTIEDGEIVIFDGNTGKVIKGTGTRNRGREPPNVNPPPSYFGGDEYYAVPLQAKMTYDDTRNKWLSVSTISETCGSNRNIASGTFYRRFNMRMSNSNGIFVPKGTLTYIGINSALVATHNFGVLVNGVLIDSLSVTTSTSSFKISDADFDAGIMSFRNGGPDSTFRLQAIIQYKLRE